DCDERRELRHVEGIGLEHIGNESEFLLAFREIGRHLRRQLFRLKPQVGDVAIIICRRGPAPLLRAPARLMVWFTHDFPPPLSLTPCATPARYTITQIRAAGRSPS